jgi:hypothetical protein
VAQPSTTSIEPRLGAIFFLIGRYLRLSRAPNAYGEKQLWPRLLPRRKLSPLLRRAEAPRFRFSEGGATAPSTSCRSCDVEGWWRAGGGLVEDWWRTGGVHCPRYPTQHSTSQSAPSRPGSEPSPLGVRHAHASLPGPARRFWRETEVRDYRVLSSP